MRKSAVVLLVSVLVMPVGAGASPRRLVEGDPGWDCNKMGNRRCSPAPLRADLVGLIEGDPGWDCSTMGNAICGAQSTQTETQTADELAGLLLEAASSGTTERVSVSSSGEQSNGPSEGDLDVSSNGRFVAFGSSATNLVPDDTNGVADIFVRDRLRGTTERVNVSSAGAQADSASGNSLKPSLSADGRFVAFVSNATNLVEGDTNNRDDIFVRDRRLDTTERVSVSSLGAQATGTSFQPDISSDGRFVAFLSGAEDLTVDQALDPELGASGPNIHVFVRDRSLGITERISVNDLGFPAIGPDSPQSERSTVSSFPSISAEGRFVSFLSDAINLVAGSGTTTDPLGTVVFDGDQNGSSDVFVRDRLLRSTRRVSVTSEGEERSGRTSIPDISADGRYVAFESEADFAAEPCPRSCVYVRDLSTGAMESIDFSPASGPSCCARSSISDDGGTVAFASSVGLVAEDVNGLRDIYLWHWRTGTLTLASVGSSGTQGDDSAGDHSVFGNGRGIAFWSQATNLVDDDTNGVRDVFVRSL